MSQELVCCAWLQESSERSSAWTSSFFEDIVFWYASAAHIFGRQTRKSSALFARVRLQMRYSSLPLLLGLSLPFGSDVCEHNGRLCLALRDFLLYLSWSLLLPYVLLNWLRSSHFGVNIHLCT